MKRIFIFLLSTLCSILSLSASTEITIKESYPSQGAKISSLSSLYFEIDFSKVYEDFNLSPEEVGLTVTGHKRKKNIKLYEGDANTGTLLETVYTNHRGILGVNDETFNLSKTYSLEDGTLKEGQLYTILISANLFYAGTEESEYDTEFSETTITFYGGASKTEETLNFSNSIPTTGSEIKKLGVLKLYFDSEIDVATEASASLYNKTTLIKSAPISVSNENAKVATMEFGDVVLNAPNEYKVIIPKEAILLKGSETTLQQSISLSFTGGTYELFGYKSISPASGSVCSEIGKVTIVPDWPEGAAGFVNYSSQYYGDDGPWVFPVNLYQGEDSTGVLVDTYKLELNNNFTALQVNVTKQLEANTKYALVFPEGLIPAWKDQGTGSYPLMKAYHSEPLTLLYIGANTVLDGKWSVSESDQLSKLGIVSFMTGGAATVNEGARMVLYNGEDSIASAPLTANGTLCYADFNGLDLEQDGDYSLVIPDSAIVNMPKTTQKFKGVAKPAEYATVSYKSNGITVASEQVLKGSSVKVDVALPDSIQLDSLMLNGEKVALADSVYAIDSLATDAEIEAALTYIPTPEPTAPVYNVSYAVKASVTADGETTTTDVSSTTATVEQGKDYTFSVTTPDDNWTVDSVVVGTTPWTLADEYTVTIEGDTTITAYYSYAGEVAYVDGSSTGVFNINGKAIEIGINSGKIVVDGTSAGDVILLYAMNGAKMGQWTAQNIRESISVASGQYIVVVKHGSDKVAAKVSVNAY